jgi:hypothetical protein
MDELRGNDDPRYTTSLLSTVWKDGEFVREIGFDEVRENAGWVV